MNKHKTSNENDNCIEILMELYFEKEKNQNRIIILVILKHFYNCCNRLEVILWRTKISPPQMFQSLLKSVSAS